jgi:hypothetical protein
MRDTIHLQLSELVYQFLGALQSQLSYGYTNITLMSHQRRWVRSFIYAKARCWAKPVKYVVDELGV